MTFPFKIIFEPYLYIYDNLPEFSVKILENNYEHNWSELKRSIDECWVKIPNKDLENLIKILSFMFDGSKHLPDVWYAPTGFTRTLNYYYDIIIKNHEELNSFFDVIKNPGKYSHLQLGSKFGVFD